jgi:hypothetical protein
METSTAELVPQAVPRVFSPLEAGIPGTGSGQPGALTYDPYSGHVLRITRTRLDPQTIAAFYAGTVELAWDATGMLAFGCCWRFASISPETWEDVPYCWRRDPARWPVLQCSDHRLMSAPSRTFRLQLLDETGTPCAERRVMALGKWAYGFNGAVQDGEHANDWHDFYRLVTDSLLRRYPSPGALAAVVKLVAPPPTLPNPRRFQWCLCENLNAAPEATP